MISMAQYVEIDGKFCYNPCWGCKEQSCYSCVLTKYKEASKAEYEKRIAAEWRVERELEPRIQAEKDSYDRFVLTNTGERECEKFSDLVNEIIDFVENSDISPYMEWEDSGGNLEAKILYLIKNRIDDDILYIAEREGERENYEQ